MIVVDKNGRGLRWFGGFLVEGLGRGVAIWKVAARRDEKRKTFVATVRRDEVVHSNINFCFLFPHSYTV